MCDWSSCSSWRMFTCAQVLLSRDTLKTSQSLCAFRHQNSSLVGWLLYFEVLPPEEGRTCKMGKNAQNDKKAGSLRTPNYKQIRQELLRSWARTVTYIPGDLDSCFPLCLFSFCYPQIFSKILFECSKLLSVGPQVIKSFCLCSSSYGGQHPSQAISLVEEVNMRKKLPPNPPNS